MVTHLALGFGSAFLEATRLPELEFVAQADKSDLGVDAGVRRLVVAGGETSGAVVRALGVAGLRIGPQIAPGVPWTTTLAGGDDAGPELALALKSGNFGDENFFATALQELETA